MARVIRTDELAERIRRKRQQENLTLREAAKQCEISIATLSRVEKGSTPDLDTLVALTKWLELPIEHFLEEYSPPKEESVPDIVEAHLRADKNLSPRTVKALAEMFRLAYEQYRRLEKGRR